MVDKLNHGCRGEAANASAHDRGWDDPMKVGR